MQLPRAWFEQIVGAPDAPADASAPADPDGGAQRRGEPRIGVRTRVTLIPLTDADGFTAGPIQVPVRDVAPGGIGFLHTERIALDSQFVVLLPQGDNDSVAVLCQVVYYQPLAEHVFAVGASFVRILRQPVTETADPALSIPAPDAHRSRRVAS
jgi:hypothetical protein